VSLPSSRRALPVRSARIPAKRLAELIAYLASDGAGYTTGASVVVDGGLSLGAVLALARRVEDGIVP
jgi:NAD(P)-dependent dehydrogenase (short-subunit alcohol dehydrogenase family)